MNWNPVPYLGLIPINWYGTNYALAFLVGWRLVSRWAPKYDIPREKIDGTPTSLPWDVIYTNPHSYAPLDGVARHASQFYELIGNLMIAGALIKLSGKVPEGALFWRI